MESPNSIMPDLSDSPDLTDADSGDTVKNTVKAKTGSLRRFFNIITKKEAEATEKTGADVSASTTKKVAENTADSLAVKVEEGGGECDTELASCYKEVPVIGSGTFSRRFRLRKRSHNIDDANQDGASTSYSRKTSTLRSSVSNYWSNVFKRKSSTSKKHDKKLTTAEKVDFGNEKAQRESKSSDSEPAEGKQADDEKLVDLCDSVHHLKISNESNDEHCEDV